MSGSVDGLYLDYAFDGDRYSERGLLIKLKANSDTGPYLVDSIKIPVSQLLEELEKAARERPPKA